MLIITCRGPLDGVNVGITVLPLNSVGSHTLAIKSFHPSVSVAACVAKGFPHLLKVNPEGDLD